MPTGQVRTEIALLDLFSDNVTRDINPVDIRDFIVTMFYEVSLVTGVSSYIYIAYADDGAGTGFTLAFNPTKDYIAILSTGVAIPVPVVGDFSGLWTKYRGDQGDPGTSILTGLVDPTILDGNDGDVFLNIVSYDIFGPKSGGIWGSGTSLIGPTGNAVLNGIIDPVIGDGVDGDFFINTVSYDIFGPKTAGVWGLGTSLIGPAGVVTNGTQLGTGSDVFKQLTGPNLEFRSLIGDANLALTENANDITFTFSYLNTAITVSSVLANWTTAATPNAPLLVNSLLGGKVYKFSGGLKRTAISGPIPSGTVFFDTTITLTRPTYGTAIQVDSSGNFKQLICFKIDTNGNLKSQQTITSVLIDDYICFEDMLIYVQ